MNATLLDPPAPRAPASIGEALMADVPHAEVDLRPPRRTPNLSLPVPGDEDAADAPTSIGNLADAIDLLVSRFFVPGLIMPSARIDVPAGWLHCLGQAVSRTVFAALYAAIGDAYGAGDGSSTFNLPQLSDGRFPCGSTGRGALGGEATHVLTVAELASHAHGVYDPSHVHGLSDPGHAHGIAEQFWVNNAQGAATTFTNPGGWPMYVASGPSTTGVGTGQGVHGAGTGISIYGEGAGWAHNNMPPYQNCIFLIKT